MPREGSEVVKYLMVDDDVEVNLEAISSKYGGGLLKWNKGDQKDNDDKKDVEENVKSEEEQPQTMVVVEVAKIDIVFFNQEEVVDEAYQNIKVVQTDVVISHHEEDIGEASQSKDEVEQNKEEVVDGEDDDD
ncbi:hypothetical protein GIB67_020018 [Kingdonia uniflora]|uniref:Uncharacterized protein n=1 Tax=Kingdonia uniflora TaxID=39325 RepID=A0A7J7NF75_9MAGN|nr:hypothetical protein GIB67_020018 [Kingdonia uniflora]